jgi:hypothetical protein
MKGPPQVHPRLPGWITTSPDPETLQTTLRFITFTLPDPGHAGR